MSSLSNSNKNNYKQVDRVTTREERLAAKEKHALRMARKAKGADPWVLLVPKIVKSMRWPGCSEHRALPVGLDREGGGDSVMDAWSGEARPFLRGTDDWLGIGAPVFDLTLDFFHSIAMTDLSTLTPNDRMELPYPALVLRFPENEFLGGARSAFVYPQGERVRMTLGETGEGQRLFTEWDANITFGEFGTMVVRGDGTVLPPLPDQERSPGLLANARHILSNMLVYIDSSGGLPKQKLLGAEVAVEREHGSEPRFRVGRPIKLGPQIRRMVTEKRQPGVAWKLEKRFVVRGHWRNQAHGEGRTQRRRQWIQPHWKGPADIQEALERAIVVDL